ncbi:transglutaminase domain-containing protein [PVC group bacterium]|nr:transglutaminase domain-containing protein [PVC group bacterium]
MAAAHHHALETRGKEKMMKTGTMKFKIVFLLMVLILVLGGVWGIAGLRVPSSRLVDFDYEIRIHDIPQGSRELKVWLPLLAQTPYQEIKNITIEPQEHTAIYYDPVYQNKILSYTVDIAQRDSLIFNVRYRVRRYEYSNKHGILETVLAKDADLNRYLKANRLVTISPKVKDLADEITIAETSTMGKARAIYDYIFHNVSYDKTILGWGNGDTERVCSVKAGNCTDFHSLFISLARAVDIPAKFVMGVPLIHNTPEGEICGYHCWAEFYDEILGWVPVDISEAWKDKAKYEYYFGTIGPDRLEVSVGRDIVLDPNIHMEPLNYFIYPYVEIDGKVFEQVRTSFRFKEVNQRKEARTT